MAEKLTKGEIVHILLGEESPEEAEYEDIIHMLLEKTFSYNTSPRETAIPSLGGRIADQLARVAGSWPFIIGFCGVLAAWITVNAFLLTRPYDPYPFILLNLVLSCLAAIQAPIIMMSQNRQEQKDRLRSENDYRTNLKAEIIIEDIHAKLDTLLMNQEELFRRLPPDRN